MAKGDHDYVTHVGQREVTDHFRWRGDIALFLGLLDLSLQFLQLLFAQLSFALSQAFFLVGFYLA